MKKYTTEQLRIMVEEVNSTSDSLDHLEAHPMSKLHEVLYAYNVSEIKSMLGCFSTCDDLITLYDNSLDSYTSKEYNELLESEHDKIVEAYAYEVEIGSIEDSNNLLSEMVDIEEMERMFALIENKFAQSELVVWEYRQVLYYIVGGNREVFNALYDGELQDAISSKEEMEAYGFNFDELKFTKECLERVLSL